MSRCSQIELINCLDHVDRTLKVWRSTPFKWGVRDCLLSVADYLIDVVGVDHGAIFRGTYDSEEGARAHLAAYGGAKLMLDRTGLQHVSRPVRGDVVLMAFEEPIAAICTGPGAAARMPQGVAEIDLRFIKLACAWKVPQCRQS
jgi:hypothetical protein